MAWKTTGKVVVHLCYTNLVKSYNYYNHLKYKIEYEKRKKLIQVLLGSKCVKCGSKENLEFDHKDPKLKILDLTARWGTKIEKLLTEINKCQLLCRECHIQKSISEAVIIEHGTENTWKRHKCRCSLCKKAHTECQKRWFRNKMVKVKNLPEFKEKWRLQEQKRRQVFKSRHPSWNKEYKKKWRAKRKLEGLPYI